MLTNTKNRTTSSSYTKVSTACLSPNSTLIIEQNVSLANKNWFKTGGNAAFFCKPRNEHEFRDATIFARQEGLPTFVLGAGANLLVHDDGFSGLVIQPEMLEINFSQTNDGNWQVEAGTGVLVDDLIESCLNNGFTGFEVFSGIPGTVGGAVFINLHYFSHRISENLLTGTVINKTTGSVETKNNAWFEFGYNDSALHDDQTFLLSATFDLHKATPEEVAFARGRRFEIKRHRKSRYPDKLTCGSFFRNFSEAEIAKGFENATLPYVAYYLDKIGVKGCLQSGGAIVSHKHANMIVSNGDNTTTTDIINLATMMRDKVFQAYGLTPQLECQLLGFNKDPLE